MVKGKRIRAKGKIPLSRYFKKLNIGDKVSIVPQLSVRLAFPKRIKGKTGKIIESRGKYKMVEIKEGKKMKKFIIHPVHLKKLK